jgi:hypothetical protein
VSALRRTLVWAFLAGMGFTAAEVLHSVHQRQPLPVAVRLVPDTLVSLTAVCVPDSLGHARVRYFQQRLDR